VAPPRRTGAGDDRQEGVVEAEGVREHRDAPGPRSLGPSLPDQDLMPLGSLRARDKGPTAAVHREDFARWFPPVAATWPAWAEGGWRRSGLGFPRAAPARRHEGQFRLVPKYDFSTTTLS
jgi:hypothetical protein